MKDRVMKTRNGVELFFDGNTFYSSNPNYVIRCLEEESKSEDEIAKILSTDLLSQIRVCGICEEVKHNESSYNQTRFRYF